MRCCAITDWRWGRRTIWGCIESGASAEPCHALLFSDERFQPFPIEQIQQFERRSARMLLANFPLPHRGETGVEHRREYCLAELVAPPQGADLSAGICRDR